MMGGRLRSGVVVLAALALWASGCDGAKAPEGEDQKPVDSAGSAPAVVDKASADAGAPTSAPAVDTAAADAGAAPAAEDEGVFFVWPQEGSKVFESFMVQFGVKGKAIALAGEAIDDATKGHHHLIIDGGPIEKGQVVPADDKHIHFGKGQTETEVTLPPGKHTLTMQFADGAHRSFGESMAATITVEVVSTSEARNVLFLEPVDGAGVKSPFKVKFEAKGMAIKPAGESPEDKTIGHHHIIVDGGPIPLGQVVPADEKHIHFGKGQTETELTLPKGKHTLTLQLADGAHRSYGPNLSSTIDIEVE